MPNLKSYSRYALLIAGLALIGVTMTATAQVETPEKPVAEPPADDDDGDGKPKLRLKDFMRQKLTSSNMILEGLAAEDMQLVKNGAQKLNHMSGVEQWRMHNDAMYRQFSGEFQRVTQSLIKAAEDDDLDRAAFQWMAATMSCIECHRYVRNELVVGAE